MPIHKATTQAVHRLYPDVSLTHEGGNILLASNGLRFFFKLGSQFEAEQFVGEAESLKAMQAAAPGLVPQIVGFGVIDGDNKERDGDLGKPYFVSEYKDLGPLTSPAAKTLGRRLATEMHAYQSTHGFGFQVPTYCGRTRQENGWHETWEACFDALVGGLVDKLKAQGGFEEVCRQAGSIRTRVIPALLRRLNIKPVLLHGDLWSGNTGTDHATGDPIIFDPSSYYGHNEADLAIGRMFGGIPDVFYTTYHEHRPKSEPAEQYELRQELYQLYHYLNHTVLFGGSYAGSAKRKMDILLKAVSGLE